MGTPEAVTVSKTHMLAALQCGSATTELNPKNGVHIHRHEDQLRVVGMELGNRTLIGSSKLPTKPAKWLKDGVTINHEGLKKRLALIDGDFVVVEWAPGWPKATVRDESGDCVFRLDIVDGAYPDYNAIFGAFNVDGENSSEPVGLSQTQLKGVTALAEVFKDFLSKEDKKSGNGMPIRAYSTGERMPVWFTFEFVPGVVLCQMPFTMAPVAPETARLMAPAMRGSLAALKANRTRTETWAKQAQTDEERAMYQAKVDDYTARIDEMGRSMSTALPKPAAASPPPAPAPEPPKPEVKPEAPAAALQPAPAPVKPPVKPNAEAPKPALKASRFQKGKKYRPNATGRNA